MEEVKPFITKTKNEERIHKVDLINDILFPSIEYINRNYSVPKELIKYYRADENGYQVLKENRIWATNPVDFNDPFDCPLQMWDKTLFPVEFAKFKIREILLELERQGLDLQENLDSNSVKNIRKKFFHFHLLCMGIFCLNDNSNPDLFWGYYNNHEGFSIVFDSKVLSSEWKMNPLKVEYDSIENFNKISFKPEEIGNREITPKLLRWATLKKSEWYQENEWRFIFLDVIYPYDETRKKSFPANAIKEVVLGYKFFKEQIDSNRDRWEDDYIRVFDFIPQDNQYKIHILSEIFERRIELYQVELSEDFELIKRKIIIQKIKPTQVEVKYTDIFEK